MPTFTTRRRGSSKPLTTAQRLGPHHQKSARQIMRKDKGLNGDLDRLPMLTWIMFLKFLDDMERIEETRAGLAGRIWRPVVAAPWRWRDWAAPADGITGADLLSFLSADEAMLPNGSRGPGCSLTCAACVATTAGATAATWWLPCSGASQPHGERLPAA